MWSKNQIFSGSKFFLIFQPIKNLKWINCAKPDLQKWKKIPREPKMSPIENLDFLTTGLLFASRITVSDFVVPICTMWVSVSQNLEIEKEKQAVIWSFSLIILNFWDDFEHQIPFQWRKETTLAVFHQNFHGPIITIAQIVILFLSLLKTVSLFDQALAQTTVHFFRSAKHPILFWIDCHE